MKSNAHCSLTSKFIFCVCNQDMKKKTIKNVDVKKIGNVFISFRAELKLNICFVFTPDRIILLVTRKEAVQCWCGREFSSNVGLAYENFSVVSERTITPYSQLKFKFDIQILLCTLCFDCFQGDLCFIFYVTTIIYPGALHETEYADLWVFQLLNSPVPESWNYHYPRWRVGRSHPLIKQHSQYTGVCGSGNYLPQIVLKWSGNFSKWIYCDPSLTFVQCLPCSAIRWFVRFNKAGWTQFVSFIHD